MSIERAGFIFDEGLRQCFERICRTVPDELVVEIGKRGLEISFEAAADQRVHAVSSDDEVESAEFVRGFDRVIVTRLHAYGAQPVLQNQQELQSSDRREPHAVDADLLALVAEHHVLPRLHSTGNDLLGLRIVGTQELQGAVREHHSEAPSRIGGILLQDLERRIGMPLLPEVGEVQAGGTGPKHRDAHARPPQYYGAFVAAITSTSTSMPGQASWLILRNVCTGCGAPPSASVRHFPASRTL